MTIIAVTKVGGDGSVLTRTLDTASREDATRWENMTENARLEVAPPYRPQPGEAVYRIEANGRAADVAEQDLQGPLRELVTAVIAEGEDRAYQPPPSREGDEATS